MKLEMLNLPPAIKTAPEPIGLVGAEVNATAYQRSPRWLKGLRSDAAIPVRNPASQKLSALLAGAILMAGAISARANTQTVIIPANSDTFVTCQVTGSNTNGIGDPTFLSGQATGLQLFYHMSSNCDLVAADLVVEYDGTTWIDMNSLSNADSVPWLRDEVIMIRNQAATPVTITLNGTPLPAPVAKTLTSCCSSLLGSQVLGADTFENITGHPASNYTRVEVYRIPPPPAGFNPPFELYTTYTAAGWSVPFPALNAGESVLIKVNCNDCGPATQTVTIPAGGCLPVTCQVAGTGGNAIGNPLFLNPSEWAVDPIDQSGLRLQQLNPCVGTVSEYFYFDDGAGIEGWFDIASASEADSIPWSPGEVMTICNSSATPMTVTLTGTRLCAPVAKTLSPGCLYLLGSQVLGADTFENITGHPASDYAAVNVYRRAPGGGTATLPGDPPGTGGWNLYSARSGVWSPPFPALNAGESVYVKVPIPRTLLWTGAVNGTWDIGTTQNWSSGGLATTYSDGDSVIFDDSAPGVTNISIAIGGVAPASVTVNNNTRAYSFVAPHGIGCGSPNCVVFTKNGPGSLTLLNINTYSGPTNVNAGTLFVDGSLAGGGVVSVLPGAQLGGIGSISGPVGVQPGGIVAPGHGGIGTLSTGPTTINGSYLCNIDGSTSDCLAVNGNLDLTNATLAFAALNPPTAVTYVLATYSGNLTGTFAAGTIPGYTLDYSVAGQVRLSKPASPGINQLLRSGTIEQFADTPLYTSDGIVIKVGAVGENLFPESERVKTALVAAAQAGGVVAPGWQVGTFFEEWNDRLIIRKTTSFEMLDGGRFNTEFFSGPDFVPSGNLETDNQPAPTEAEVLAMAATYIASGEHLSLYPAAAAAGNISPAAFMTEIGNDRGPVTITETIEFARVATPQDDLEGIQPGPLPILGQAPVAGAPLTLPQGSNNTGLNFPIHFGTTTAGSALGITCPPAETATYSANMLNGFTIGKEWTKTLEYNRKWCTFRTTASASFGLGVRIPWQANVEVCRTRIDCSTYPDRTPFEASIKINTLDANVDFYQAVGLPPDRIYDGQELVTRVGATINVYLKVFKQTYLNNSIGKTVDLGRNFDPPLGTTLPLGTVSIPFESTGLGWNVWYTGIGVDLGVGFGITGTRFDISVSPQNSTNLPGYATSPRTLGVTDENVWKKLDFAIRDTSPTQWQSLPICRKFYRYGPLYENASYHTALTVAPKARVRCTLYLSKISRFISDVSLTSDWWTITTVEFNLPKLGPHANTVSRIDASTKTMRVCPVLPCSITVVRATTPMAEGNWAYRVFGSVTDGGVLTEYLPAGAVLAAGSITGGGVYNAATGSITWEIAPGSQIVDVSYTLTAGNGEPQPLGQWLTLGAIQPLGVLNSPDTTQEEANSALLIRELAQRPTLQEIQDGRAGSVLIQKGPNGMVQLRFHLQTSEDLMQWTTTPETLLNPIGTDHPLNAPKRFFRFKIAE